ncbi:prevent-host-death protein [Argonema antarcticum]|uniref:prevent-host-death protein n=1 Tax=Argonema antarcticum TaxID=2942763 RepID=UPI0020132AEA|nr:prevent-host-death protein [Argonema antarcticum]MCL1472952.1 prevent-host-death protein [Argonema antarcticum A004/B2]
MNWKLDEAQQKLRELIDAIANEPQLIFEQDKLVAVIVEPTVFEEFLAWHQQQKPDSIADAFVELRQLCAEEDYILETPTRCDRDNPFALGTA